MRNNYRFMMGLAAIAMAFAAAPAAMVESGGTPERVLRKRGKGLNNRRGKGVQAKPRNRSNKLTISKRVRRKHRRAA